MTDTNWDHLRSLLTVARSGTFTAAAKALGLKHSTVSRHILELERSLQTKLLDRAQGGLRLTNAGERLYSAAEAMEQQFSLAEDDIRGRDVSISGTVRIGAPDAFGSFFLAPRLVGLIERHPTLVIQLVAMPRIFNLTKREADIAIALAMPEHGRLIVRKLADYGLGLYGSRAYLENNPEIRSRHDLHKHRFIDYIDDLIFTNELDYLDEVASGARAAFQSSNIIAQLQATRAGFGLCILPYFLAQTYTDLELVLPEQVRLTRSWWILIHEDQKDLSRIRATTEFICREVAREAGLLVRP